MRLLRSSLAMILLLLVLVIPFPKVLGQYGSVSSSSRTSDLTIKLVFLGISQSELNESYLNSPINLPQGKNQVVAQEGVDTGVIYNFHYQTLFAEANLVQSYVSHLQSIGVSTFQDRNTTPTSQWNPYFSNSTSGIRYVQSSFYNASAVEDWFASNLASFGTQPVPGYTLFIANLAGLIPNSFTYTQYQQDTCQNVSPPCTSLGATATVHYYNRTAIDPDLGEVQTRHYMTAWGGNSRFYYIDLSAGPSILTGTQPLQVAAGLSHVTLSNTYGVTWFSELVSDYVWGAVNNLFAPDQIYPVSYSQKYVFHLFVIDNRTQTERTTGPSLQQALNTTYVQSQLASLAPFANITVIPQYLDIQDYPVLESVVIDSSQGLYDPNLGIHDVDVRPIWDWLSNYSQKNIKIFLPTTKTDTTQIDIPAFIFAFQQDYEFGITGQGNIFQPRGDGERPSSLFGIALPDMAFISHSQDDLTGGQPGPNQKGLGLTQVVVHELGHEMGLVHPFMYDTTEGFVDSVMAYYPVSTHYSQFDHDAFLRGINDELLGFAQAQLAGTSANLLNLAQINSARSAINRANLEYNQMNYQAAVQDSLIAATNADNAHSLSIQVPAFAWGIVGGIIGVVLGLVLGYLMFNRRQRRVSTPYSYRTGSCPTCGGSLRWDPMLMHWYCDNCRQAVQQ